MSNVPTNPQDDAERIRLKRLAKLQGPVSSSSTPGQSPSPAPSSSTSTPPPAKVTPPPVRAQPPQPPVVKKPITPAVVQPPIASPVPQKRPTGPVHLDLPSWEAETVGKVFNVTLDKAAAERSGWEVVWLKELAEELAEESSGGPRPVPTTAEIADRLLISRLELDSQSMSDDLDFLPVLASLPPQQTVFEYLVGCWKRLNIARTALTKRGYPPVETQSALAILEQVRELVISYAGLSLQEPEMFPQPSGRPLGVSELVIPLVHLSSLSTPLLSTSSPTTILGPNDVEPFLQDLVRRFEPDNEIDGILGPVVQGLCHHESLIKPEGLSGGDAGWRGIIGGLEALVSIKGVANMIPRLPAWNPEGESVKANNFEFVSLLGPLLRLGVFQREWPSIAKAYFTKTEGRPSSDEESATASLRGTLKSLQSSLFQIFNALVRASPESREAVLQYFARIIALNDKRAGKYIEAETVASDSFMVNVQAILLRFCEPFMDANYTKIDRIDINYFNQSNRINIAEETRVNATSEEAEKWRKENSSTNSAPPNFITEIFYLTLAMNHFGYQKTISSFEELVKQADDMARHREELEGDGSWRESPMRPRVEHAINQVKAEEEKIKSQQLAYAVQLCDPELVFRSISFVNFVSAWIIRSVDPTHSYPKNTIELPLPKEVPMAFRTMPEFAIEDVVDYHLFVSRNAPATLELAGKTELLIWCLTFLTSTWYIKNPSIKSHLVFVLFYGSWPYDGRRTLLVGLFNSHPMALKHLMSAMMTIYIEVEQTGASSQFYDKFSTRRYIASIFRAVWNNQNHREALKNETRHNMDKFIHFVNLMINDVTYLMDESLADLAKIHEIQTEMGDTATYAQQSAQHRREREGTLRTLERQATSYVSLGDSTVALLKVFTGETKAPFMAPEIRDRLAAMLDYNLDALVGPRCQDLRVQNPEKYKFNPKQLLGDILQVYLNLSDQGEFAQAVAADGRSYRKELFERAAGIARKRVLKSEDEIERLRLFVVKVEETKATMEAEDDMGEIPDEFLDPLMYTVMRDPVILPTSKTTIDRSTIKSHLLSDATDPFNRQPLKFEDVLPDLELKARIDQFLSERRNKNTAFDQPAEDLVHMDTSEDVAD
ncbi:hypothetical protein EUX98_g5915 [Antrodiella citrinella]|uniref:RING-type E3 ubiquitin transferase n=1 Tax=Antrodiella citrinella TaxID=2447956 RepID=A0A4S4MR99_9APHY|nr:hypothetical protein EUX98_g5915 [Antrodiella citrinella]